MPGFLSLLLCLCCIQKLAVNSSLPSNLIHPLFDLSYPTGVLFQTSWDWDGTTHVMQKILWAWTLATESNSLYQQPLISEPAETGWNCLQACCPPLGDQLLT